MRKKSLDRIVNKIHDMNIGVLSTPILIKRLLPLNLQTNYNSRLREWYGDKQWETVADTSGIIDAFKQSEEWREIGTIGIHDYKCTINDNLGLAIDDVTNYIVIRKEDNKQFEIVFYREYIGEVEIGLRPVM